MSFSVQKNNRSTKIFTNTMSPLITNAFFSLKNLRDPLGRAPVD